MECPLDLEVFSLDSDEKRSRIVRRLGTTQSFPVSGGKVAIGTWQQIVLCDFDERPRDREVMVTVVGDP